VYNPIVNAAECKILKFEIMPQNAKERGRKKES
jgi:hypothetical protein